MEVACGEHGDYVQKLVIAVNAGRCEKYVHKTPEPNNGNGISNVTDTKDIATLTKTSKLIPTPNGVHSPNATCTTSLLDSSENLPVADKASFPTSSIVQFWILLKRTVFTTLRDNTLTRMRLISHFVIGVLLGLIYYNIGNDAAKVMSNAGCIFFTVMFTMFSAMMPTILTCESSYF